MSDAPDPAAIQMTPEQVSARKRRNMWLGFALAGFVVLVMLTTIIRLTTGDGVSVRM
ncbi:MAG: hypothetical protein ACK46Q_08335 [Hyphomonas sp.]